MRKLTVSLLVPLAAAVPVALASAEPPGSPRQSSTELIDARLLDRHDLERHALRRARLERRRARTRAERRRRAARRRAAAPNLQVPPQLQAIAQCESGGNPRAIGGGGMYRGKYQFSRETWAAVGGSGDPAAAPEAEQDRRAALLYARAGSSPWPVCG